MRASLTLIGSLLLCGCPSPPGGKIAEDSKTPQCRAELQGALEAIKRDLGFGYEVTEADADALVSAGAVAKQYARDGVRVSLEFGLETGAAGCSLVAYKMTRSEPGRTVTSGTQGRVALDQCTCIAGPES